MKNCIAIVFFVIAAFSSAAQVPSSWLLKKDYIRREGVLLGLDASGSWGSNALDNEWLKEMVIGGHINTAQKDRLLRSMEDRNRAGGDVQADVHFYSFTDSAFGNDAWGFKAGVSTVYSANAGFAKDLFRLAYYGNIPYLGDTLDFGRMDAEFQSFQKVGFGIFNKDHFSSIQLSLVSGQDMQRLNISDARWYSSFDGSSTSLRYAGEYFQADTSKSGFGAGKGFGVCIDAEFNLPMKDGKGFISVALNNIGYIRWNNAQQYRFDSTFVWNGLTINDVLNLGGENIAIPDWKDTLGIAGEKVSRWMAMPGSIRFRMLRQWNQKHSYEGGIHLRPNMASLPFVFIGMNHFVSKGLLVSERVVYGGYGRLGVGFEAQWKCAERTFVRLGTNHAVGWVNRSARGLDLFAGMTFSI